MSLIYLIVVLFLFQTVVSNQCSDGTNSNILKSIEFNDTNPSSTFLRLYEIEYDSGSDDYFYLGDILNTQRMHFVSRLSYAGSSRWDKIYSNFMCPTTFQYSSINQMLLYTIYTDPYTLMSINSSSGTILSSYQLSGISNDHWWDNSCSLSGDELAFYCNMFKSDTTRELVRFDTSTSRIDTFDISYAQHNGYSVLAMSSNQVLYSYNANNSYAHHIVKVLYDQSSTSFNEQIHLSISGYSQYRAVSQLGQNNDTVWHAVNMNGNIVYFQSNSTDLSLIGTKHMSSQATYSEGLDMKVSEGVVCILGDRQALNLLIVINATTQDVIQVYDIYTQLYTYSVFLNNEYISIAGCNELFTKYCSHNQIPIVYGYDELPMLNKISSYTFNTTTGYAVSNVTLTNFSMSTITNQQSSISSIEDTLEIVDSEGYVLSLPNSLNHSLAVSPGQTSTIELPCRIDSFSTQFTCGIGDDSAPSWVSLDCNNSQIQIQDISISENDSDSFSVNSAYQDGSIISYFDITLVPCNEVNCDSCQNGICLSCSTGYTLSESSVCVEEETEYSEIGPTYNDTASTVTAQVATGAGAGLGFISALVTNTSPQDVWAIIHLMQIVLLFPLIAKSMSKAVQNFIASNAFAALCIYFVPVEIIKSTPVINDISFDQPDKYLRVLGWSSGSTLVNNIAFLIILSMIGICHLLFCLLHHLTKDKEGKCSTILSKIYRYFTFNLYIRIFIEIYMFTVLMIASEIKYYIKNEGDDDFGHQDGNQEEQAKGNYASLIISCLIFILTSLFLILVYISWKRNKDSLEISEDCKTREIFKGMIKVPEELLQQENEEVQESENLPQMPLRIKLARAYYMLFLVRRLIMTLIAVIIPSSLFALKITFLFILQILCIVYAICVRSFANKKDQLVEVFSECTIFVLMIIIVIFSISGEWSQTGETMFVAIVLFQPWTLFVVSAISICFKFTGIVKNKRNKHQQEREHIEDSRQISNSNQENNHQGSKDGKHDQCEGSQSVDALGVDKIVSEKDHTDIQNEDVSKEAIRTSQVICCVDDEIIQDFKVFPKQPNSYCLTTFRNVVLFEKTATEDFNRSKT